MDLLPDEIRRNLPRLYATEKQADPTVWLKLFTPDAHLTFYATEFDGEDTFFGLVVGQETELGYFSLAELQALRGRLGLPVERDVSFAPIPLSKVRRLHQHRV